MSVSSQEIEQMAMQDLEHKEDLVLALDLTRKDLSLLQRRRPKERTAEVKPRDGLEMLEQNVILIKRVHQTELR